MRSWPIFIARRRLDELWKFYQPDYERGVESLRAPVSDLVFTVSNYLREIVRSNSRRSFSVYVEPLAGGKTIFKTFGDQYALVVRPSADPPMDDIRHAFLHFLLDPIAIRYRVQASKASPLLEYAAHAPQLPVDLHDDFSAFFDECLVRAVELRLRRLSPADLASAIDQAEGSGYVLVRPIYAGLSGFEKSEPAMGYYLPDLIKGIDVEAEQRRLRGVKFADAAPAGECAAGKQPRGGQAGCHRRIRWMTIWPKGSGRFPRETAPRPPRPLNECSRRIRMMSAPPTALPWLPRFRASRTRRANFLPK